MQIPVWYWRLTQIRTGQVGPLVFALACIAEKRKFMINVSIWLQAQFVAPLDRRCEGLCVSEPWAAELANDFQSAEWMAC